MFFHCHVSLLEDTDMYVIDAHLLHFFPAEWLNFNFFLHRNFLARRPTDRAKSLKLNSTGRVLIVNRSWMFSHHVMSWARRNVLSWRGTAKWISITVASFFLRISFSFLAEKLVVLRPLVMSARIMLNIFTTHTWIEQLMVNILKCPGMSWKPICGA